MQDALIKDARLNRDSGDWKKRLIDTWVSLPQNSIDEAVDQWHQHGCAHV